MNNKEPAVQVGDTWVFSGEWTMKQMQALMDVNESLRQRLGFCYVLTAISVLLSLVALVLATIDFCQCGQMPDQGKRREAGLL